MVVDCGAVLLAVGLWRDNCFGDSGVELDPRRDACRLVPWLRVEADRGQRPQLQASIRTVALVGNQRAFAGDRLGNGA